MKVVRRFCGRLLSTGLALVTVWPVAPAHAAGGQTVRAPAAGDELIVGFKRGASRAQRDAALARADARVKTRIRQIDAALVTPARGGKADAISRLERQPGVRYAEPNFELRATRLPDDPGFPTEWGLRNTGQFVNWVAGTPGADIGAVSAWDVTTGSAAAVVGVLDTGIDVNHPDLAQNVWLNPGENCPGCRTDGVDNDANGYVDDWRGWDFFSNDNNPDDDNGHGTHVAGTIGAIGDNGIGVVGVNWNVRLMALKFIGADGSGTTADAIRALLYATDEGAAVTNNSYGGDGFSQAFADAIAYADQARSLFVAAAGNSLSSNDKSPQYPSSYELPNIVSVAATDSSDNKAWFSNYGAKSVDLGAPGDNVYSTWPNGGYDFASGTSMASPHVAGAAALAKSAFPTASGVGLKALLLRTADPTPSLATVTTSGGRLDAGNAVHCAGSAEAWIESPTPGFVASVGDPVAVVAIGTGCGDPGAAAVTASANGSPIALSPRGDGLYTGSYTPDQAGPLSIRVSAGSEGGSDTRTVSGTVPQTIVPGGAPVSVTAATAGDNPLLAFRGSAGQRVSLVLSAVTIGTSACCGAKVAILNPDGSTLVSGTFVGTSGGFIDTRTLSQTGTYSIVVDPQGSATGSATLTLYDVPADVSAAIVPGGPQVALPATTVPGQNARATFDGSAGRRVSLNVGPLCCATKVSIVNPDGSALLSPTYLAASGGFIDTKALPQTGTYSVVVDPQATAVTGATLTLYDVPADPASEIVPGGPQLGLATTVPGQNARASFDGSAGRRVSLVLSSVTIGTSSCCGAKVSILNPDGSTLVPASYVGTSGGFVDTRVLPQSGSYSVVVDPQGTATGGATLALYDVPADASAAIVPGGPQLGLTTTVPGQNAKATFDGSAGRRVSLNVGPLCCAAKVSILSPDGTALLSPTYMPASGGFIDTKTLPQTGTYTVVVDPQGTVTGSAALKLYDVPADVSAAIVPGGPQLALPATTVPGQNATATFDAAAGRRVSLSVGPACCSTRVSVLDPDGATLVAPTYMGTSGFIDAKVLPKTGTYTILVDHQGTATGSVTLTLHDVPADAAGTLVIGGPPMMLTIATPGQNAAPTFIGTAGRTITLQISIVTISSSKVAIAKPDSTYLVSPTPVYTNGKTLSAQLPVDGTYLIVVDPQGASVGRMTLALS